MTCFFYNFIYLKTWHVTIIYEISDNLPDNPQIILIDFWMKNHQARYHRKKQNFLSHISSVRTIKKRREKKLLRISRIEELGIFIIRVKFTTQFFDESFSGKQCISFPLSILSVIYLLTCRCNTWYFDTTSIGSIITEGESRELINFPEIQFLEKFTKNERRR